MLAQVDSGVVTAGEGTELVNGARIALRSNQAAMRPSRPPDVKTPAQFDFALQPTIKREQIESLHELGFLDRAENVILLGPPGVGRTHLAISLAVTAEAGRRVCYGLRTGAGRGLPPDAGHPGPPVRHRGGASKTYAMTGWRLGWAIGPAPVIKGAASLQSQMTSNASSISQKAALAAVTADPAGFAWMTEEFARRMVRMRDGLLAIDGVRCGAPDGGFYLFPNFEAVLRPGEGSGALASALLDEQRVATVLGVALGHDAHLRLSYATSDEMIDEGVGRIQRFFAPR